MPNIFNIVNVRINNVSNGGVVNFGDSELRGNSANSKSIGGNSIIGDATSSINADHNITSDPDVIDQPTPSIDTLV